MSVRRQRNRAQNAVKRQSVGSQSALTGLQIQMTDRTQNAEAVNKWHRRQPNTLNAVGLQMAVTGLQMAARRQPNRAQNAVKRQSNGVNRRLRGCKCQSDDSEITLKTSSNGSQSAVKWQSIGAYAGKCQSDDSDIALKTPHGSQSSQWLTGLQRSVVKRQRQSIGAYRAANVSQMTAKSRSKRRQTAVSRQSNGSQSALTGQANVSQMTATSRSKRRQMAVSRQSNGSQSALTGLHGSFVFPRVRTPPPTLIGAFAS